MMDSCADIEPLPCKIEPLHNLLNKLHARGPFSLTAASPTQVMSHVLMVKIVIRMQIETSYFMENILFKN